MHTITAFSAEPHAVLVCEGQCNNQLQFGYVASMHVHTPHDYFDIQRDVDGARKLLYRCADCQSVRVFGCIN